MFERSERRRRPDRNDRARRFTVEELDRRLLLSDVGTGDPEPPLPPPPPPPPGDTSTP